MVVAEILVLVVEIYFVVGILFGIAFVTRGVQAIDHAAEGTGWRFRLIILPGVAAFWPLLLRRWIRKAQPAEESNAHRARAGGRSMIRALRRRHLWMMFAIALIVPALLAAALLLRRPLPKPDHALETSDSPIRSDAAPVVED